MKSFPPSAGHPMLNLRTASIRPARLVWGVVVLVALAVLALGGLAALKAQRMALERRLLTMPPQEVEAHPDLVRFAVAQAKPLFAADCAGCHGATLKGRADIGAPDLTDRSWLYGDGGVFEIERTILYGVRSGQPKGHDVTEMPAYGQRGQLSEGDIRNLVQYLLELSHRPHDEQAAVAGRAVFGGAGQCYDCHAGDAKGDIDYGAPDLTANAWSYGGDPAQLYNSIYYGRHGVMPAWYGKLTLEQIRALAVYVHAAARP
jgi:cytochrome c oxidase cbb3-type subunit 3